MAMLASVAGFVAPFAVTSVSQAQTGGFTERANVVYENDGSPFHYMNVYMPTGQGNGPFPGVLVIHPGGWKRGTPDKMGHISQELAMHGLVAFGVAYRLAPESIFPAQLEDMQHAVEFIRSHASEFKVNPKWMGALGASAGGELAGLLGTAGSGPTDRHGRVNAVVTWSGPMDLTNIRIQFSQETGPSAVKAYLGCKIDQCPERYREASPIAQVDPTDAAFLLANSTLEKVDPATQVAMFDKLRNDGIPAKHVLVQGQCHALCLEDQTSADLPSGETVLDGTIAFFHKYIKRVSAAGSPTPTSPSPTPTPPPPPPKKSNRGLLIGIIAAIVAVAGASLAFPLLRRR